MERLVVIVCGFVGWLLGVAWSINALVRDARFDFWVGVLVAVLAGTMAAAGRQMPQGAAQGAAAESMVLHNPPTSEDRNPL